LFAFFTDKVVKKDRNRPDEVRQNADGDIQEIDFLIDDFA